jgi:hypothetical protein
MVASSVMRTLQTVCTVVIQELNPSPTPSPRGNAGRGMVWEQTYEPETWSLKPIFVPLVPWW